MIYERIRLKLHENAVSEYKDDLRELKERLAKIDENAAKLTMYELDFAWRLFSEEQFASFLVVHEGSVDYFMEWLKDED